MTRLENVPLLGVRLISTENGYVGWGHSSVQKGDFIYLVSGCLAPLILRSVNNDNGYVIVGDAHVYGNIKETGDIDFSCHIDG